MKTFDTGNNKVRTAVRPILKYPSGFCFPYCMHNLVLFEFSVEKRLVYRMSRNIKTSRWFAENFATNKNSRLLKV